MGNLKDDIADDLNDFFDDECFFAVLCTFTSRDNGTTINDLKIHFRENFNLNPIAKKTSRTGKVYVRDENNIRPLLLPEAKFVIDSITWLVEYEEQYEFGVSTVSVRADVRSKFS